jgi:hypothetical protein
LSAKITALGILLGIIGGSRSTARILQLLAVFSAKVSVHVVTINDIFDNGGDTKGDTENDHKAIALSTKRREFTYSI